MSNISSENIHVFPFGTTRNHDRLARVLNEQNITQLVKNMTDYSNYVLRYKNNIMDFIIQGYYFSADVSEVTEPNKPLYAHINLHTDASNYFYLAGGDIEEDNKYIFTGVTFSFYEPEDKKNSLQLLDSTGNVPEKSRKRVSADSLDVNNLDVDIEETVNSILNKNVPNMINTALDNVDLIYCGNATTLI